jgi:LAO/AO transport system kinase
MELADLLLVTKCDGDLVAAANRAAADYQGALHLMRPKYSGIFPEVMQVSAIAGMGIAQCWETIQRLHGTLATSGQLKTLRAGQSRRWFWNEVQAVLSEEIMANEELGKAAKKLESAVTAGKTLPYSAARSLFRRIIAA